MLGKIRLSYIYDIFEYDTNYNKYKVISPKKKLQYLSLALIHRVYNPSIVFSLNSNYTAACRETKKFLR